MKYKKRDKCDVFGTIRVQVPTATKAEVAYYVDTVLSRLPMIEDGVSEAEISYIVSEWNHDKDHVHILFKAHPNTEISKFINAYKSASSRLLKKEFPQIRQKLWKEYFWSQSFCLITTGGAPIDIIKKYIESQGEKH